jgi:hypothetical protein
MGLMVGILRMAEIAGALAVIEDHFLIKLSEVVKH